MKAPIGHKDIEQMLYELHSDPKFIIKDFGVLRNLLFIAEHFFETHNDDGTPKKGNEE